METVALEAQARKNFGKRSRNLLRNQGKVPGVYYSRHDEPIPIEVPKAAIQPLVYSSATHLILLKVEDNGEFECVLKDVQFDPVTDEIIHVDLMGLKQGETFQLEVPIQLVGTSVGVREGGLLQHALHKVEIECLPKDIPQHLEIDISNLNVGDSVHVKDLNFENIKILNPEDTIVVSVVHPKVEKEEEPTEELLEGEEAKEPEVIEKGKESAEDKKEE